MTMVMLRGLALFVAKNVDRATNEQLIMAHDRLSKTELLEDVLLKRSIEVEMKRRGLSN